MNGFPACFPFGHHTLAYAQLGSESTDTH
ncbi:MAG: hypothetical protein JWL58_1148, partial [Streptosporangiaceae bacterium]|nr:hypothetical protein [Streptosporangiaceae bacterium]